MDSVSDEKITAGFIKETDSSELLKAIYEVYGGYLYWVVFSSFGRNPEISSDVFNELFSELGNRDCRRIRMFEGRSSFKTYITSVWRNMLVDYIRRERSESRVDYLEPEVIDSGIFTGQGSGSPESEYIKQENEAVMRSLLKDAMSRIKDLSADEKMVLRLRIVAGRKFEDINRMTGIRNSNYMFKAAMQKVRNSMDEESRGMFLGIIEER